MKAGHLSAIVLSAGFSRRMGRFKPLLQLGATMVVKRVVDLYRTAGIDDVCVVVGYKGDEVVAALDSRGVRCVINPDVDKGMFSSVMAGVRALPERCSGFFVHPVDLPLVRTATVKVLAEEFSTSPDAIHHPCFDGRRGHPPLLPAALAAELADWRGEGGLRAFWAEGNRSMRDVPVADQGILLDLDTEEDYHRMAARLEREDIPTDRECRVLMAQVYRLPEAVRRHCDAVAAVAMELAAVLARAGVSLDLDLVRSAALVHDVARDQPDHAATGARLLEDLGFPRLASVVRVHMDLEVGPNPFPDEAAVVYLADKLVVGHRLADLGERFERKLSKYGADPQAVAAIERRKRSALAIQAAVERITGLGVQDILQDVDTDGGTIP